ncbi:MAG: calcium/sodium antiporter [Verrucomicrobia bacterium]|nr:calcium/sodium antiporter [Verrucomicrobiota bacterium]MCH8527648.1 calcium/sodium antiporter [Kiritimatiellia bacterium]
MLLPILAVVIGLLFLAIGSDRFITGAAVTARRTGISPLLIGIVIIGFGTSVPELIVSAIAALQGNPALAVGNAFGSNIANIALILGLTAVVSPIRFQSGILKKELPLLTLVTLVAGGFIWNLHISRTEGVLLLIIFVAVMAYTLWTSLKQPQDPIVKDLQAELCQKDMPLPKAAANLGGGLLVLIISSRALVWGAVEIAATLGVSDLIIGLSIVAFGTSLPELAASFASVRKGEHELAVGNIVGSNLFNTLAVVGIAGGISPFAVESEVLNRDFLTILLLTLSLFAIGYGHNRPGRINRVEGALLLTAYAAYLYILYGEFGST